jgi:molybdopterin-containing oxidoreductase family iron-sulfur binding subunit
VNKSIPYVLSARTNHSWSSRLLCDFGFDGFDFALVKTREGRPIKIDNNTIVELSLVQMQEFMLRYFHCMTTWKEPKIEGKIQLGLL